MNSLLLWLTHYGYAGLFCLLILGIVGAPVPDETLLVFCGYLVYSGRLHFAGIVLAGFLGSVCGISISYFLGLKFGRALLDKYGRHARITPGHIARAETLFTRFGPLLLAIGYFIPGVRHFTAVVAGMSGLRFLKFALFAYIGAAFWVCTFITLGFLFADRWQHTSELVHRYTLIVSSVTAVALLCAWLIRRHRLE